MVFNKTAPSVPKQIRSFIKTCWNRVKISAFDWHIYRSPADLCWALWLLGALTATKSTTVASRSGRTSRPHLIASQFSHRWRPLFAYSAAGWNLARRNSFTVRTIIFRALNCFFVIGYDWRRILHYITTDLISMSVPNAQIANQAH